MTLVCALAVSCSQKEEFVLSPDSTFLTATVESSDASTKVGFTDGAGAFFWTSGDVIGVTTDNNSTSLQPLTLTSDAGNASGLFGGNISGVPAGYAVYPYGEDDRHSLQGTVLTYTLPAEYTYTSTDAVYANKNGNSHNAPMWGAIANGAVAFKHLGGVFAIQVNNLPANKEGLKLVLTATNKINGTFTADLAADEPAIATSASVEDADRKVTINFKTAAEQTTGYFYIPLPTGEIGNLRVKIVDSESNQIATGAWDNKTVTRKMIARAVIGQQSVEGAEGPVKSVETAEEVSEALENVDPQAENLVVNVTDELKGATNAISIPTTLSTETTTFSFAEIADDAAIQITAAGEGDASYSGQIIIEIPETETLPTVTANVPNGEVYIKQGTVTTLVVASADNTTIIGAGAKVGTLEVLKGNVRILNGGKVTTIKRSTGNTDAVTNVIFEGELPSSVNADPKIIYVSAAEWDLIKAAENGGTYTMTADVTLSEGLVIENDFTLNMGGKTITAPNGAFEVANGTLTIKNGVINSNYAGKDAIAIVGASESSKIIVNVESDATVKGGDCCVVVYGSNKSKDITINTSGTLVVERKGYSAIQANGSSVGVKMNVTGGSITAVDAAIYFPCTTSLNISGGTITGATAVYQKSGELNISGGKLVGNGAKVAYSFNGSGCNETGDALVVESCNYPSGVPSINITGGEFVSVNASAIGSYVGNGATEKITGFVKGGIFNAADDFDLSLLADGYGAYELTDNKWTVVSKTTPVEVSSEAALKNVAAQGGVAVLKSDITLTNYIEVRSNLTVHLNDMTLIHPISSNANYKDVFEVYGDGCLTIEGNGEVIAEDAFCVYATGNSKVFINGGYYFSDITIVDARKNAVVTINDGEFKVDGTDNPDGDFGQIYTLNLRDKTGSYVSELSDIIVKGGKFWKYNPAASESEPEITNFVAEGYKSVQEGDYYVVFKTN